jgi:flagellar protein FlaG
MSDTITAVSATIPTLPASAGRVVSGGPAASRPASAPAIAPAMAAAVDEQDALADVVAKMQRQAETAGAELQFSIDEELDRVVVTVRDRRDGSVLRQIPSEEALRIARALAEQINPLVQAVA